MKVIVYPHDLLIGGSQINAIDLAAVIVEQGHDALVYAVPGPLSDYVAAKGLQLVPAHRLQWRPAPTRMWELARLALAEDVDLIHGYEWPPCLDAYYGAHLLGKVPLLCTVLSMSLVPLIPKSVPLIMGTRQLLEHARRERGGRVELLEPPIDAEADHPEYDGADFRRRHAISDDEVLLVVVSRLSIELKLDALTRVIDAVGKLCARLPLRLVIVGDGDAAAQLRSRAATMNAQLAQPAIHLVGPTLDPRPAYAAADVVVGMGTSALRGMAFGKPVVVQGEAGFSAIFDETTTEQFYEQGFYGIGDGEPTCQLLCDQIERLVEDRELRERLGRFGRAVVVERYSLRSAATTLLRIYDDAIREPRASRRTRLAEAASVGVRAVANEARFHLPSDKRARRTSDEEKLLAAAGR